MSDPLPHFAVLADRYRIERELGAGGMATVYLAEDLKHHRLVAIKVLREDLGVSLGPERFAREITIAAGLTHPLILAVHDSGEADGRLFYVMPFVDGPSLRQRLAHGELPITESLRVLRDIADAMAYAHRHGVVHRDIKPENVMISGRHALVSDFGVAKALSQASGSSQLTTAGVALGTPAYMAPEQATADPLTDYRADIYAFGVVAYELLAGRPPFIGNSPQEVLAAHVTRAPEPLATLRPSVPPTLAELVMKCLEKRPSDRWQSADELVPVLESLLTPSGGTTPSTVSPHATPSSQRNRLLLAGGGALLLVSLVAGTWLARRSTHPSAKTERIAVIPFDNRTGNPAHDQLGALAADWVTRGLVDAHLTEVVPASIVIQVSKQAAADRGDLLARIADVTGATKVVTGAYYSTGDSIRIESEMVDAASRTSVDAIRSVTAPAAKVMQAIDSLRHRVLGAVAQMTGLREPMAYSAPPSLDVYRLVMRAEDGYNAGRYGEMEQYYRQAYQLDSSYVYAGAGLANALWVIGRLPEADTMLRRVERLPNAAPGDAFLVRLLRASFDGDDEGVFALLQHDSTMLGKGGFGAQRALQAIAVARPRLAIAIFSSLNWRSPDLIDTPALWRVKAEALHLIGDDEGALTEIRRVRTRFLGDPALMRFEGQFLAALGRRPELASLESEARSAPQFGEFLNDVATEQYLRGDSTDARVTAVRAVSWFRTQPAGDSSRGSMQGFRALLLAGKTAEYLREAPGACPTGSDICWTRRGLALALTGDAAGARAAMDTLQRTPLSPRLLQGRAAAGLAQIAAALGENDRAVGFLREALEQGFGWGTPVRQIVAPFPTLRAHPEFKALNRPKG